MDLPSTVGVPEDSKYRIIAQAVVCNDNYAEACRILGLEAHYASIMQWKGRDKDGRDDWDVLAEYYRDEMQDQVLKRLGAKAKAVIDRTLDRLLKLVNDPKSKPRGIGFELQALVKATQLLFGKPTEISGFALAQIESIGHIQDPERLREIGAEAFGRMNELFAKAAVQEGEVIGTKFVAPSQMRAFKSTTDEHGTTVELGPISCP